MHELSKSNSAAPRRMRTVLIASGTALVMGAGAFLTGAVDIGPGPAQAETEEAITERGQAEAAAPFDFAELAEEVRSSVVSVQVEGATPQMMMRGPEGGGLPEFFENLPEDHPMRRFFRDYGIPFGEEDGEEAPDRGQPPGPPGGPEQRSQGSGFFVSEDGYIVTNSHVVSRGDDIRVVLEDGREYNAEIVGIDSQTDLALLKIEPEEGETFDYVSFTGTETQVGEWVIAVGNPFGLGGTVTAGIISATGREIGAGPYDDFLQIDASVNRGNSGGPAFNLDGEVVGVNTAIFSPSGGNVGIAFAIPASVAVPVIEQLQETGEVRRGWLGVQIQPVTEEIAESVGLEEARGAIVADLMDTGPAGDAGIEPGDIVLSVDEAPVDDARDLARRIGSMAPGEVVTVQVWRDGEAMELELELGLRPADDEEVTPEPETEPETEDEPAGRLGLSLAPADTAGVDRGVMIVEVDPEGEGARRGLQSGDVILEAGGEEVSSPEDVRGAVERAEEMGRSAILLRILQAQDESQRFVALTIADS